MESLTRLAALLRFADLRKNIMDRWDALKKALGIVYPKNPDKPMPITLAQRSQRDKVEQLKKKFETEVTPLVKRLIQKGEPNLDDAIISGTEGKFSVSPEGALIWNERPISVPVGKPLRKPEKKLPSKPTEKPLKPGQSRMVYPSRRQAMFVNPVIAMLRRASLILAFRSKVEPVLMKTNKAFPQPRKADPADIAKMFLDGAKEIVGQGLSQEKYDELEEKAEELVKKGDGAKLLTFFNNWVLAASTKVIKAEETN